MSQAAMNEYVKGLEEENERLRADLAEAEEVIKPFALKFTLLDENHMGAVVEREHLRKAAAWLEGRKG